MSKDQNILCIITYSPSRHRFEFHAVGLVFVSINIFIYLLRFYRKYCFTVLQYINIIYRVLLFTIYLLLHAFSYCYIISVRISTKYYYYA